LQLHLPWYLAGVAGAAVSSVWNYAANRILTWQRRHPYNSSPSAWGADQSALRENALPDPIQTVSDGSEEKIVV
jgi:hypothetical protein